ncbi:MAG TPA: hypothetical protein VFV23_12490 [Verrucomicrobiae bacterium]|nr:hypothetical protein [Verrucomicrobiae bacterium]
MNKNWLKIGAAVAAVVGLTGMAQADQINGDITFTGGAQLNTGSSGTATGVLQWQDTVVESSDGDLSGITPGTAVAFHSPWFFSGGQLGLWSVGGFTYDLNLSSIKFQGGTPAGLVVTGQGTLNGNDYDPTPFSWAFTVQDPGAGNPLVFSFSAAAGSISSGSVPDGGTTVMLLGGSLLAIGLLKKKLLFA